MFQPKPFVLALLLCVWGCGSQPTAAPDKPRQPPTTHREAEVSDERRPGPDARNLAAEIHFRVGNIHVRNKRFTLAVQSFGAATSLGETRHLRFAKYATAWVSYQNKDYTGAQKGFRAYLELCGKPSKARRCHLSQEARLYLKYAIEDAKTGSSTPQPGTKRPMPKPMWVSVVSAWPLPSMKAVALRKAETKLLRDYYLAKNEARRARRARSNVKAASIKVTNTAAALLRAFPRPAKTAAQALVLFELHSHAAGELSDEDQEQAANLELARALGAAETGLKVKGSQSEMMRLLYFVGVTRWSQEGKDAGALAAFAKALAAAAKLTGS